MRLGGKGFAGAKAHLRYIQRDGTMRDGAPGQLYDAENDRTDGKPFLDRSAGDRHQFRFIVSAEDGDQYDDLKPLIRRLMAQMEEDLGTGLDWVAVDHFNTGHPHSHILLRGKDERGTDLVIARDYIRHGMRARACEFVDLDLGPRTVREVEVKLRSEVDQERLTSIDRALCREARDGLVSACASTAFDQAIRTGRLAKLERMGLAKPVSGPIWRLDPDLTDALAKMGERGDIIRTMQRAMTAKGREDFPLADHAIFEPGQRALVGGLIERGLSDELNDRQYLIVDATDGRTHYVDIGNGDAIEPMGEGAIVHVEAVAVGVRKVDRTVIAVAAQNGGSYDIDAHLKFDPSATEEFAEAHVRRLEAMRRLTGGVERQADGSWVIAGDHLERVLAYEASRARARPVTVDTLSTHPLNHLIDADAATWLDKELVSAAGAFIRQAGFGKELSDALGRRRQWLMAQQLAQEREGVTHYRPDLIETLRRRELLRVAGQLSEELGLPFVENKQGEQVEGRLVRKIDMLSGRHALIERAHDFTIVPWRPVLERQIGKRVAGLSRRDGISWSIGRSRSGPEIT